MPTPRTEADEVIDQIGYCSRDDHPDAPLYVALHLPRRPVGAALIIGSIGWEYAKNYRREVLLGRRLAANGLAVARFHYRGLGESGGRFDETTLASMADDARQACDLLRRRTGCAAPGLVGIRTGALVVAALSDELGPVPVVLWDPVLGGADYVRELTQIRRVWQVTRAVVEPAPLDAADGRPGAPLEVLGYRLSADLVQQLREARLGPWLESSPCAVLSLHVGAIPRPAADARPASAGLRRSVETVPGKIDWWMKRPSFEPEESSPVTTAMVSRTVRWLTTSTDAGAGPVAAGSRAPATVPLPAVPEVPEVTAAVGGARREAVRVGVGDDQLAGVFTGSAGADPRLAAVILNCGGYHPISGPAGLWTLLADKLAALGVPSLRVAYRGVDDSAGVVTDFDLTRPRTEELRAARTFLTEFGYTRHILLGGCLGARTCCDADLEGVAGLGLVSLPWHRESLGTGSDSRRTTAAGPADPLDRLNADLLGDLRRCVAARLPMRIVYSENEPYHRDFRAAEESGVLTSLPQPARSRLGMKLVAGPDSMVEPHAVSDELADFVAGLLAPRH